MAVKPFVYLIGAGPGAADLITLRGLRALQKCEVLIYDRLAGEELLEEVPADCEKIYVGKEVGNHSLSQKEINNLIIEKALENKIVVRLKGGDPFVFGRGGEEVLELLKAQIPFELVPGVTSAISVPELAGIPVTHREVSRSFHVITGHTAGGTEDIRKQIKALKNVEGTLVFLMGRRKLPIIVKELLLAGREKSTPVAMIENGSLPEQRVLRGTLQDIEEEAEKENISSPCIIVVGETAAYQMLWGKNSIQSGDGTPSLSQTDSENKKLLQKTVAVVGTEQFTHKMCGILKSAVKETVPLPVMEVQRLLDGQRRKEIRDAMESSGYLVFTSANGVEEFFSEMNPTKEMLVEHSFAAIGKGTGEALERRGISVDYIPQHYTVEALAEGLCSLPDIREKGIMILRAKQGSAVLTDKLEENHIPYRDIKIYDVVCNQQYLQKLLTEEKGWDYIILGSSSGVRGFLEGAGAAYLAERKDTQPVCIGEVTAETLRSYGYENILVAGECSAEGILKTMLRR